VSAVEVDLDLLADFVGGALDGMPQAATVERLVAVDPAWARAYADLRAATESVHTQLSALGAVDDLMPADVVARLDAALESLDASASPQASESARTPEGGILTDRVAPLRAVPDKPDHDLDGPGEAGGDRVVVPLAGRRRWVRWAAPVAVAAGVLACVGLGVTVLQQQQSSKSSTSTAASTQDKAKAPMDSSGTEAGSSGAGAATAGAPQWSATGTNYRADTVVSAVGARALTGPARAVPGATDGLRSQSLSGDAAAVPAELRDFTAGATLTNCLNAIAAAHGQPPTSFVFVDFARFGGSPAIVVSLVGGDGQHWVWVSGPQCGRSGADTRFSAPAG
jgi:hypothetical protein